MRSLPAARAHLRVGLEIDPDRERRVMHGSPEGVEQLRLHEHSALRRLARQSRQRVGEALAVDLAEQWHELIAQLAAPVERRGTGR